MKYNIKSFKSYLKELIKEQFEATGIVLESSLSRIWQFIEEDKSFGTISAFRREYSLEVNLKRHKELKTVLREKGYGFIELKGGFNEEGVAVEELSLFVPNIPKKELVELGVGFEQYSVIYKDDKEFVEIGTNEKAGIDKIKHRFSFKNWDKNITFDKDLIKDFFSSLMKGSHRDKKFLFNVEEGFLFEKESFSFNEVAYGKKKPGQDEKWLRIL